MEARPGYVRTQALLWPGAIRADGGVSALVLAVAADCGVGVAVQSSVPGSMGSSTVELRVDWAGGPAPHITLAAHRGVGPGRRSGVGQRPMRVRTESGDLVATAVGLMVIDPPRGTVEEADGPSPDARLDPDTVVVRPESVDGAWSSVVLADGMVNPKGTIHGGSSPLWPTLPRSSSETTSGRPALFRSPWTTSGPRW